MIATDKIKNKYSALVFLFHFRWAVPVLAELHADRGAKFITLVSRLHVSRDALQRTLKALIHAGLIRKNPGYGHPMRPEYILTKKGTRLGPDCVHLMDRLGKLGTRRVGLRKWSMPVLLALRDGVQRFSQLDAALPGITARALTMALKDLEAAGLVERVIVDGYPPKVIYKRAKAAKTLLAPLEALMKTA